MINKSNAQLSQDIGKIIGILNKINKDCKNPIEIYNIQEIQKIISENGINYKLNPLVINLRHCYDKNPKTEQQVKNLKLKFSIKIDTTYYSKSKITDKELDGKKVNTYFGDYEFNIIVKAENSKGEEVTYSLHLDMHDGSNSSIAHPEFHFQFGGRHIKGINSGNLLVLDTPRIMHYPMDFILGFDFILSNFAPKIWEKVKEEKDYRTLIKDYQKMFIEPYFKSIYSHFDKEIKNPFREAKLLFPQIV